ncbi:MAG: thiamine phosphate synthase [Acidobacteriota bacterium]
MRLERPILCLVTDRRRLAGSGATFEIARARLAQQARAAADAAIDLIQVRERDLETAALIDLVAKLVEIVRGSATRIVVNDRVDVALACGADGVHLRSDSIAPAADAAASLSRTPGTRRTPSGWLVGRSVHDLAEAVEHAPMVDYLIAGTVFPTVSKPGGDRLLGERGLSRLAAAVTVPVLAIGGVTIERVPAIAAGGAAGVAAIGLFLSSSTSMQTVAAAVRAGFDRVGMAS